jgi:hypothetical protein
MVNAATADRRKGVAIVQAAALTPAYADVDEVFEAWCAGMGPAEGGGARAGERSLDFLCRGAMDGLRVLPSSGLILATTKGEMAEQVAWMRQEGREDVDPPTLDVPLRKLVAAYGMQGPSYVVSTACTSGLVALIEAALLVLEEEADSMVALAAEVAGDFVRDGFHSLHALSHGRCRPFDRERDGLTLGSAAAACVLTRDPRAVPRCVLSGWGISNDATHMTAPDRHAGGLIRAMTEALNRAGLVPADIDVVFAHGTGTRYNDAMECVAIEKVFLAAGCSPAVTAAKGFLGHTLGAAGLIEAVLGIKMLERQIVPAITGLRAAERGDIDFVAAARPCRIRHVLKIGSGFGGMNAAVVLSQGREGAGHG